jgi:hypothetical protein
VCYQCTYSLYTMYNQMSSLLGRASAIRLLKSALAIVVEAASSQLELAVFYGMFTCCFRPE